MRWATRKTLLSYVFSFVLLRCSEFICIFEGVVVAEVAMVVIYDWTRCVTKWTKAGFLCRNSKTEAHTATTRKWRTDWKQSKAERDCMDSIAIQNCEIKMWTDEIEDSKRWFRIKKTSSDSVGYYDLIRITQFLDWVEFITNKKVTLKYYFL